MFKNEKGLTYPVVLMIIVLFCFFFTFQMQLYLSEKELLHHSKTIKTQEYYMHTTVKKIEISLENTGFSLGTGEYKYHKGIATYQIDSISSHLLKVSIMIRLNTLEEAIGFVFYDKNQKKFVNWIEKN